MMAVDPKAHWEPDSIPSTDQTTFTYQQLCALLLYLGGDYDDDGFVPTEAMKLLQKAKLIDPTGRTANLTDLGEDVFDRLESGGDAPEIEAVANG